MSLTTISFLNTLVAIVSIGCLFLAWQCFRWVAKRRLEDAANEEELK